MLLIVDHFDDRVFRSLEPDTEITVLPLGIMPALYQSRLRDPLERHSASVFPIEEVSDEAMARLRSCYPDFLHDLVRQPIADGVSLLEMLDVGEGSLWWFTDTAEKSPLRTPFLNQLYILALIDEALSRGSWDRVRLCLVDQVLGDCIKVGLEKRGLLIEVCPSPHASFSLRTGLSRVKSHFWFRFLAFRFALMVQALGNRFVLAIMRVRRAPATESPAAIVFSRYPVLYADPLSNHPCERNLGDLIPPLRRYGSVAQVVLLNLWPWNLLRHRVQVRAAFRGAQIIPLILWNTIAELLGTFFSLTLLAPLWKYRRLRHTLEAHFGFWDAAPVWRAELDRALTGYELFSNLLLYRSVRRLCRTYRPRVIIHPCEFQPMERAIWVGLKQTETRSVAVQHTTVSSNTLMFFFAAREIPEALSGNDKLSTPLPDFYVTTGDWPLEIMRDAGFPPERSATVGAVRYNDLLVETASDEKKAEMRNKIGLPVNGKVMLVATSSDRADSMTLLEALAEAMPRLPASPTLLFKSHYHCRIEGEIQKLFASIAPENVRVVDVDADLHTYLRASDAALVTNSTTGLEAIALDCPAIVFDNRAILNIGPLGDLREAALFAHTPEGLAEAIRAALDPATVNALRAAWPAALTRTFHALDGKAHTRFLEFLEKQGLLPALEPPISQPGVLS
jgi:hypothetical protein